MYLPVTTTLRSSLTLVNVGDNQLTGTVDFTQLPSGLRRLLSTAISSLALLTSQSFRQRFTHCTSTTISSPTWLTLPSFHRDCSLWGSPPISSAALWTSQSFLRECRCSTWMDGNQFTGAVDLTQLPPSLYDLQSDFNQFTGTLNLTQLPPALSTLFLQGNNFCGQTKSPNPFASSRNAWRRPGTEDVVLRAAAGGSEADKGPAASKESRTGDQQQDNSDDVPDPLIVFDGVEDLDLSRCFVRDKGFLPVVEMLYHLPKLTCLSLSDNDLSSEGIECLVNALQDPSVRVAVYDMGEGAVPFAQRPQGWACPRLRMLSISHNKLGIGGVRVVADLVKDREYLTDVVCDGTRVDASEIRRLERFLAANRYRARSNSRGRLNSTTPTHSEHSLRCRPQLPKATKGGSSPHANLCASSHICLPYRWWDLSLTFQTFIIGSTGFVFCVKMVRNSQQLRCSRDVYFLNTNPPSPFDDFVLCQFRFYAVFSSTKRGILGNKRQTEEDCSSRGNTMKDKC